MSVSAATHSIVAIGEGYDNYVNTVIIRIGETTYHNISINPRTMKYRNGTVFGTVIVIYQWCGPLVSYTYTVVKIVTAFIAHHCAGA